MIIVWSLRAVERLAHFRSYIERDNPKAANRIAAALLEAVERLAQVSQIWIRTSAPCAQGKLRRAVELVISE